MTTTASSPAGTAPAPPAGARTLGRLVLAAADRHAGVAMRVKRHGAWVDTTFPQVGVAAREIARGLIALGVRPGDRVGVLGNTRPEWTLADCGALCAGAVVVPVYHTNSPQECEYVLGHAGVKVLICEDAGQAAKIAGIRDRLPALEHVITMTPVDGHQALDDLRAQGTGVTPAEAVDAAVDAVAPEDVATIVYTSGTTGPPKGCMLSHAALIATADRYIRQVELTSSATLFLFLPLAHGLARMVQFVGLDVGGTLAFWQGDSAKLLEDLAESRPTHIPSVPRVFEKLHTRALASVESSSPAKKALAKWALATGRRAGATASPGPALRAQRRVADRLVLRKLRNLLGGNIELALTGAAPIARDVLEFFQGFGVLVLEGWGLTESCAAGTLNTEKAHRFGSVGRPLPDIEMRVGEDGELLLRGPILFTGYYREPEATADILVDGWLRTGDLGRIDEDGYVFITGRKKDIIITSSGKNVAPSELESALRESRWISQAIVYGDKHPYLVAALTLDPEEAPALAEQVGCPPDVGAMAAHPEVHARLQAEVDRANARFARIEQVKRFTVLDHDLTQAGGHLTPTLKVKRNVVYDRYRDLFEDLYARGS
jgi:long-chain acyl-CoA synthetase